MSDILDRLKLARTATGCYQSMGCKFEQLIDDAADEIFRLLTELSELRAKAEARTASLTTPTLSASCVPEAVQSFIAERVKHSDLVRRAYNESPNIGLQTQLGSELQWWLRLSELLAAAPSPTGLDNPEAPKS